MPAGRPTIYNNKLLDKTRRYVHRKFPATIGGELEVIPTIEGLCIAIKIHKDTLYEWIKDPKKQEFSDLYKEMMQKQGRALVNNSLVGTFSSPIAKIVLSKHDYIEKTQTEQKHTFDNLTDEQRAKLDNLLKPRSA